MKLSIAQLKPFKGDIAANIAMHLAFIELALSLDADAIFFPELSITGYEPTLAKDLAFTLEDERLNQFDAQRDSKNITIGLGVPLKSDQGVYISMIVFQPGKPRAVYSKQQLHEDELPFFIQGKEQLIITLGDKKIAPAICYESLQPSHAKNASLLGADVYVASVAKSKDGVAKAIKHYPTIAKEYSMPVLMCNSVGPCDNFLGVGSSAIWSNNGGLLIQLDAEKEGLLLYDTTSDKASAHYV